MRYNNMNWSAVSGNHAVIWGSSTNTTQALPYKLGTLQESALPYLLYSLPYSPIAASLIQDQCHLPVISCSTELSLQITHEPSQHFPLLPPTLTPQQEMLLIFYLLHCALPTGPLLLLALGHSIYQSKSLELQFLPSALPRSSSASYN